jgi:hypothetical protein
MCLPSPCLAMNIYSDFAILAFGCHVTPYWDPVIMSPEVSSSCRPYIKHSWLICLCYDHFDGDIANRGTDTLVRDCAYSVPLNLHSPVQTTAICFNLPHLTFAIFYMCFPPGASIALADPINLISQLPPPFIFLGDFPKNALSWSALTDERGQTVSRVCAQLDLFLSNPGAAMHLNLGSGTSFALGLAFCSPGLAIHLEQCVHEDLHGSDHYLVNPLIWQNVLLPAYNCIWSQNSFPSAWKEAMVALLSTCFMLVSSLAYSSTLKMGDGIFLWNVDWFSTDYMALYPRWLNFSISVTVLYTKKRPINIC